MPTQFLGNELSDSLAVLADNPHHCDAWNAKGCMEFAQGEFAAAFRSFSHAVALSDQYHHYIHYACAAVYIDRARLRLHGQEWQAAAEDLDAAIFQDHGAVPALLLRAWIAERPFCDGEGARKYIQQIQRYTQGKHILSMPQDWQDVPAYMQAFSTDAQWREAIVLPSFPPASLPKSTHDEAVQLLDSAPDRALQIFTQLCTDLSTGEFAAPLYWRSKAKALAFCRRWEESGEALDTAILLHRDWHTAYHHAAATHRLNRALAYDALGETLLAAQDAQKAVEIDKNRAEAKTLREALMKKAFNA